MYAFCAGHDLPLPISVSRFEVLLANIVAVESHLEFSEMHSDYVQAISVIFSVPALQDTEVADAVDTRILPEIDQLREELAVVGFFVCRSISPAVLSRFRMLKRRDDYSMCAWFTNESHARGA